MKSLRETLLNTLNRYFIFEGTFGAKAKYNWDHATAGIRDYAILAIKTLLEEKPIKFINDNNGEVILNSGDLKTKDVFNVSSLKKLLDKLENGTEITSYNDFNDCVSKKEYRNVYKWQNIDKIFITGKSNKGLKFEKIYETDFNTKFKMDILAFLSSNKSNNVDWMHISDVKAVGVGGQNNKRTLYIGKHSFENNDEDNPQTTENLVDVLKVNPSLGDGKTLSDVTLFVKDGDGKPIKDNISGVDGEVYLSLKSGDTVCFLSCGIRNDDGIKKEFCEKVDYDIINNGDEKTLSEYLSEKPSLFGNVANEMFNTLGINDKLYSISINNIEYGNADDKFVDSTKFINLCKLAYPKNIVEQNGNYICVDLKSNSDEYDPKWIQHLLREFIGCKYVMVHQNNKGGLEYFDLRNKELVNELLGNTIESIIIKYPSEGKIKRFEVVVKVNDNLKCTFVMRDKQNGTAYPTHLMCDYKLSNAFQQDRNMQIDKIKNKAMLDSQKEMMEK